MRCGKKDLEKVYDKEILKKLKWKKTKFYSRDVEIALHVNEDIKRVIPFHLYFKYKNKITSVAFFATFGGDEPLEFFEAWNGDKKKDPKRIYLTNEFNAGCDSFAYGILKVFNDKL